MKKYCTWLLAVAALMSLILAGCSNNSPAEKERKKKVYFERGMKYTELEDDKSALAEFKNAVEIDPKFAQAYYQMALVHLRMKKPIAAANAFARVAILEPSNLDARLKLAEILFLSGRKDDSRILTRKILEKDPDYVDALALLVTMQTAEAKLDEARKNIDHAIALKPDLARLYVIRADVLQAGGHHQGAEEALLKALALEPANPKFHENLVKFYMKQNQSGKAIAHLKQAVIDYPKIPALYANLVGVYEWRKEFEKAEQYLSMIEKNDSENYKGYLFIGDYHKRRGNTDKAEMAYKKAFSKAQNKSTVLEVKKVLADFYYRQDKYKLAGKLADEILVESPGDEMGKLLKKEISEKQASQ